MNSRPQRRQHPEHRRRRPVFSCQECRRRKIKCDHNNPCTPCLRYGAQCIYRPYADGFDHRSSTVTVREHDSLASSMVSLHDSAPGQPSLSRDTNTSAINESAPLPPLAGNSLSTVEVEAQRPPLIPAPPSGTDNLDGAATLRDLLHRIQKLEESSQRAFRTGESSLNVPNVQSEVGRVSLVCQSPAEGMEEWQAVLNKSRVWGRSLWKGAANEFTTIIACYSEILGRTNKDSLFQAPETSVAILQARNLLRECKNRVRSIKSCRPSRSLPSPACGFMLSSREEANAMVNLYFASFESTYVSLTRGCVSTNSKRIMVGTGYFTPLLSGPST